MGTVFLQLWLAAGAFMVLLWLWQWYKRDATIVDVGWSAGMILAAALIATQGPGDSQRRLLVGLLGGFWAARLAGYLFVGRVLRAREEDGRYQRMRRAMGGWAQLGFFVFFQVQAVFVILFALPWWPAAANPAPLAWTDWAGLAVGLLAIAGESLADWQLARFRADSANRGRTCDRGLWRYSRHPNYFCEWLHWFAYPLLAAASPVWWLAWLGPPLMLLFLWKVTGIPHTEKQAASHRADYEDYRRRTSMFFPWFPS